MGTRPPNPKCAHTVSPGHLAGRSGLRKHETPGPRLNCREDEALGLSVHTQLTRHPASGQMQEEQVPRCTRSLPPGSAKPLMGTCWRCHCLPDACTNLLEVK